MSKTSLYIVPTPIGNLGDMTYRAVDVLKHCELILAEDTRQTLKLLNHYQIKNKLRSFNLNNEHRILPEIIQLMENGLVLALCSDAGTPGISDPGFLLIRECIRKGIKLEVLPGATAVITALVASGLPSDKFLFEGFLPHKKGKLSAIRNLKNETRTTVFFESPHRILKTLLMMAEELGHERYGVIARELTKKFEEVLKGNLKELIEHFETHQAKGEFVLILAGSEYQP
jgi:16S rRNA (cytidine1402-2'-O)-methyltransferase